MAKSTKAPEATTILRSLAARRTRDDGPHATEDLTEAFARATEVEAHVARSAEIGAVAEADAPLLEFRVRVLEAQGGDVEPREEA